MQESSCDNKDLKELLVSWKLENILCHLIAENINVEILEMMKVSHIKSLLYKFPLGTQIRFEHNLQKWRHKIGKPLKYHAHNDTHPNNQVFSKESLSTTIRSKETNSSLNNTLNGKDSHSSINLKELLLKCPPDGPELLETYRLNQTFSNPERSHLINVIVKYYLEYSLKFDLEISYELENAILTQFPNEKLEMYRNARQGKMYFKYLAEKAVYKKDSNESSEYCSLEFSENMERNNKTAEIPSNNSTLNMDHDYSQSLLIAPDNFGEDNTVAVDMPSEILIQTLYNGRKQFIKIFEPYLYQDFFLAACVSFNVANKSELYIAINGCEILANDFKNVIIQYYKLPTFNVELKEKVIPVQLTTTQDLDNFQSASSSFVQSNTCNPGHSYGSNIPNNVSTVQVIYNYLPDANDIRKIPALLPIVKMSDDGKVLENRHRATIAKAIVDECLNFQPDRILKRQDFITLTQNLVCAFPMEVESTYFIPAQPNHNARGKLCNAYNNKRRLLASSGVLERRVTYNVKRKHQSDGESDKTNDKVYVTDNSLESIDFSLNSKLDWETIKQKWSETHRERRQELIKEKLQPQDYLNKYSILMSYRAIELMEIDVKILHPKVLKINNWMSLYNKIVEKGRTLRKVETMSKILENIDSSNDEKYRASLALLIIPYIFLHNARHNEIRKGKATKYDVQQRFIKEYETLDNLKSDIECADLQLRFVNCRQQISYAEFKICDQVFKCVDLLEALNSLFHYKMALNVEYPRMCLHIWQFIQLAIFQIEIQDCMQANVESTFNDLCRSWKL